MAIALTLIIAGFGIFRIWWLYRDRSNRTPGWYAGWLIPLAALVTVAMRCGVLRSWLEAEKLLGACCEPEGLIWLATLACALMCWAWRQRATAVCLGLLWIAITLNGNAYVASALMRSLERQIPPPASADEVYDVVEVLGGGTDITPAGKPELGEAGDRILCALQLYHDHRARLLVASGSTPEFMGHARSTQHDQEATVLWHDLGVPRSDILEWPEPTTTSQEISRLASEAAAHGWNHIAVVSSAWHLPRVLRLCRGAHLAVTLIPCDYHGQGMPWSVVFIVPHAKYAFYNHLAAWEYLAALGGR